jgi:hypothetical protein
MAYNTNILDLIYELESSSGKNKKAYVENSVGALGGYQVTRKAYIDLQNLPKSRWKGIPFERAMMNDNIARQAAQDYLGIIHNHLVSNKVAPTRDALLAAYHSGMGNAVKGKLGPQGHQYLARAKALAGMPPEY